MSKIKVSSELMKNYRAASVLKPRSQFAALQNTNGHTMFFSIGDDGVFNLIIEKPGTKTGWKAIDLSSELSAFHDDKTIAAQTFAVTQNANNGNITIALVVRPHGEHSDTLYILSSLANSVDAGWMESSSARDWVARPYDDAKDPQDSITIAYIYLTPTQKELSISNTKLVAGVRNATTGYIQNYTVNLSGNKAWSKLQTSENFDNVLGQAIGKSETSSVSGLYQLTHLHERLTINFIPMESVFGPPTVTKMKAPDGASKIATLPLDDKNNTNLFIAAKDGLYLFTPETQVNFGESKKIIDAAVFAQTQRLYAHQSNDHTIVWGLNQKGEVFYTRCARGQESRKEAWSHPIPILNHVLEVSSFITQRDAKIILFAHTHGQELLQLTQDPQATLWHEHNILLPSSDVNEVVEFTTFSTHIQLTRDDNLPLSVEKLSITSSSQCSVTIDDKYYLLSPDEAVEITTDATGTATIIQETQDMSAVCYQLTLGSDGTAVDVNPMSKVLKTISGIKTGEDLSSVTLTNADGSTKNLLPDNVSDKDADSTAKALHQLTRIAEKMPQDGSTIQKTPDRLGVLPQFTSFVPQSDTIWGIDFTEEGIQYHESTEAMAHYGLQLNDAGTIMLVTTPTIQLASIWDTTKTVAGDLYSLIKQGIKGSFPMSKVLVFEGNSYVCWKNEDIRLFYDCTW